MKKRFEDIDFLRGFAILIIIITHVYGLHLGNARDFAIWNWLHFVVPGFLFCSGFVLASSSVKFTSLHNTTRWMGKRLSRLLMPYYIYFFFHFLLFLLLPAIFNNFHFKATPEFILGSVFFTGGGVSLSWLPVLFTQLTLFFPVLWYLKKKNHLFLFKSSILALIALIMVTGKAVPLQNLIHWIFWLYPFTLGYLFAEIDESKRKSLYLLGGMVSLGVFIFLFLIFSSTGASLVLTHHKYPPDLFYLSFALGIEFLLLFVAAYILRIGLIKKTLQYFSINSYRVFFVHFIVLDAVFSLTRNNSLLGSAPVQSVTVILLTVGFLVVWDRIKVRLVDLKPKRVYK